MTFKSLITKGFILLSLVFLFSTAFAQEAATDTEDQSSSDFPMGKADAGKELFKNNCAACHNKDMKSKMTGPALAGVEDRWADYPMEDLYEWIRNSQSMVNAGHPRAVEVYEEWNKVPMTPFLNLTDEDIENMLIYINGVSDGILGPKPVEETVAGEGEQGPSGPSNKTLFIVLFVVLGILSLILAKIINNLDYTLGLQKGKIGERKTFSQFLLNKTIISFVVFAFLVWVGYSMYDTAVMLGRSQGYQPDQPVKFSHATHAGQQQIDCQYCHDGARRSKHSVIPAANTCMNCHKAIMVGSTYGTAELSKIYASIGYDPNTQKYIEDYESMSQEDIEGIFKKWIGDNVPSEESANKERIVGDQWKGIVTALTNEESGDDEVQGAIEWVKVHNLPDHVYYNHAQHVTVGGLECQTCHGKVEEMEVVEQYSPLSMAWCVNCHRQTKVQFADNDYYKAFTKYHKEISDKQRDGVTVEEIGGLECQKCHY